LFLDNAIYERRAVREQYRKRFEEHPDSIDDYYLYGRSLVGSDTQEALRIYSAILARDPDYPWVHYSQLLVFRSSAFRDRVKLEASFEALTRVCPSWTEPYRYLTSMDEDAASRAAARLRGIITRSTDPVDARLYPLLWQTELRVRPKSEQDAEKQRIAEDLRRLRELDADHALIANGARLIGDAQLAKEMTPPPKPTPQLELRTFDSLYPFPKQDDPPEKRRAYAQAQLRIATKANLAVSG